MLLYKFAFKSHSILRIFLVLLITTRSFDGHLITTMELMNIEEQLEEQSKVEKSINGNCQEHPENGQGNDANLANSPEKVDKDLRTSAIYLAPFRRRLPLEMNCEMYKFLNFRIQKKLIWGMGRGIYQMFGPKLLFKTKRVRNPHGNRWDNTNTKVTVAPNSLSARNYTNGWKNIYAKKEFPISGPHCRVDEFPGTISYYYEIKTHLSIVGLTDDAISTNLWIGRNSNSYAIPSGWFNDVDCWLAGETHRFELPEGAIWPTRYGIRSVNVYGCGLLLDPYDKLAIFFTLNGKLLGRKIPINPTVDRLFPAVSMIWDESFFEANFGDNPAKPFEYDILNCPGLGLACI